MDFQYAFLFVHMLRLYVNDMFYACVHFYFYNNEYIDFIFLQMASTVPRNRVSIMILIRRQKETRLPHLMKIAMLKKRQNMKIDKPHMSYDQAKVHVRCYSWGISESDTT